MKIISTEDYIPAKSCNENFGENISFSNETNVYFNGIKKIH